MQHRLQEIHFEWDSRKAISNFLKHGVAFEEGCEVFFDPFLWVGEDELIDDELRETAIGMTTNWHLLYVAYTLRNDIIRLISVRPVTRAERIRYENQ
ncbi:MAG TPA: BrnT family toxin [Caldilineaceae bacterium]|nr:BrnT family toxin [Caldilineaceae bacterium]